MLRLLRLTTRQLGSKKHPPTRLEIAEATNEGTEDREENEEDKEAKTEATGAEGEADTKIETEAEVEAETEIKLTAEEMDDLLKRSTLQALKRCEVFVFK